MNKTITSWLFLLVATLLAGTLMLACKQANTKAGSDSSDKPLVVTTIGPYKYLLQQLAGDFVKVLNTSEGSADPHTVDVTPEEALQLQKAAMFFSVNPLEEDLILKGLGKDTQIVEMWHGFPLLEPKHHHEDGLDEDHVEGEEHLEDGEQDEGEEHGWDEHFWTSPSALKKQISGMAKGLVELLPEQESVINANRDKLMERCDTLAKDLRQLLPDFEHGKIFAFHSSLSYFAEFFDAEEISVEAQGLELGAADMLHLFEEVVDLTYPVLIYSPQFQQEKAKAMAEQLNLGLVEFDPQRANIFASLELLAKDLAASKK